MTRTKGQFGKRKRLALAILMSLWSLNPGAFAAVADTSYIAEAPQAETGQGVSGAVTGVAPAVAASGPANTIDAAQEGPLEPTETEETEVGEGGAKEAPEEFFVQAPIIMRNGPYMRPQIIVGDGNRLYLNLDETRVNLEANAAVDLHDRVAFANFVLFIREQNREIAWNERELARLRNAIRALENEGQLDATRRAQLNRLRYQLGPNDGQARQNYINGLRQVVDDEYERSLQRIRNQYPNQRAYLDRLERSAQNLYDTLMVSYYRSAQEYWRGRVMFYTNNYGNPRRHRDLEE